MKAILHRLIAVIALVSATKFFYQLVFGGPYEPWDEYILPALFFFGITIITIAGILQYFPHRLFMRILFTLISLSLLPFACAIFIITPFLPYQFEPFDAVIMVGSFALSWTTLMMLFKIIPAKSTGITQTDAPKSFLRRIGIEYKVVLLAMVIFYIAALHFMLPKKTWDFVGIPSLLARTLFIGLIAFMIVTLIKRRFRTAVFFGIGIATILLVDGFMTVNSRYGGHNEASAIATLKLLVSTEGYWKQTDTDGNGIRDFWTLDVSCLNRLYRVNGTTKVAMIDIALAKSDTNAFSRNNSAPFNLGNVNRLDIEDWGSTVTLLSNYTTTAKSGYYFMAMLFDENGQPYNQNTVGINNIKACNSAKYAFVAFPSTYGISGVNTFIVNESGNIYQADCGSDANKIVIRWPGADPTKVKGPGGEYWQPAE